MLNLVLALLAGIVTVAAPCTLPMREAHWLADQPATRAEVRLLGYIPAPTKSPLFQRHIRIACHCAVAEI